MDIKEIAWPPNSSGEQWSDRRAVCPTLLLVGNLFSGSTPGKGPSEPWVRKETVTVLNSELIPHLDLSPPIIQSPRECEKQGPQSSLPRKECLDRGHLVSGGIDHYQVYVTEGHQHWVRSRWPLQL
jgi:hypothetical protein